MVFVRLLLIGAALGLHQAPGDELVLSDILALLDLGVADEQILDLARERGLALTFVPSVEATLRHAKASASLIHSLKTLSQLSVANDRGQTCYDPRSGVTWFLPEHWEMVPGPAGGMRFTRDDLPAGSSIDMTARILQPTRKELQKSGIVLLDDYHARRVKEIETQEGKLWSRVGTWPLPALGWTGIHTVFKSEPSGFKNELVCLTWFSNGQHIVSLSTKMTNPTGLLEYDDLVDEITWILTHHVPRHVTEGEYRKLMAARDREVLLLVDGDGRVQRWRRKSDETRELLGTGGTTMARLSDDGTTLIAAADGIVTTHRGRPTFDSKKIIRRCKLPIESLKISRRGDWVFTWEREVDGSSTPRALKLESGETRSWPAIRGFVQTGHGDFTSHEISAVVPGIDQNGRLRLSIIEPDSTVKDVASPIAVENLTDVRVVHDDEAYIVFVEERPRAESRRLRLFLLDRRFSSASRELWSVEGPGAEGCLRIALAAGTGEIYLLTPTHGLLSISRQGGLPVRLMTTPLRDVSVVR